MEIQKSRQQMFEEIQRLQRDLADSAWEYVSIKHEYSKCNKKLNDILDFINGHGVEASVGMALGPDSNLFDTDNVVKVIRGEIKKIIEQNVDFA